MQSPILYILRPRNAEYDVRKRMRAVKRRLADPERRRRFFALLESYGIRAAIITPEYIRLRALEAETKLVLYTIEGDRFPTSMGYVRLAQEASKLLFRKTIAFSTGLEYADKFKFSFRLQPDEPNPVLEVFKQLDAQG